MYLESLAIKREEKEERKKTTRRGHLPTHSILAHIHTRSLANTHKHIHLQLRATRLFSLFRKTFRARHPLSCFSAAACVCALLKPAKNNTSAAPDKINELFLINTVAELSSSPLVN
jgi:hypothetical protein